MVFFSPWLFISAFGLGWYLSCKVNSCPKIEIRDTGWYAIKDFPIPQEYEALRYSDRVDFVFSDGHSLFHDVAFDRQGIPLSSIGNYGKRIHYWRKVGLPVVKKEEICSDEKKESD